MNNNNGNVTPVNLPVGNNGIEYNDPAWRGFLTQVLVKMSESLLSAADAELTLEAAKFYEEDYDRQYGGCSIDRSANLDYINAMLRNLQGDLERAPIPLMPFTGQELELGNAPIAFFGGPGLLNNYTHFIDEPLSTWINDTFAENNPNVCADLQAKRVVLQVHLQAMNPNNHQGQNIAPHLPNFQAP